VATLKNASEEDIPMKKSIVLFSTVASIMGAMLMLGWGHALVLADQTTTFLVHPEKTFQTMVGFGAGFNEGTIEDINAIKNPSDRSRAYDLLYDEQTLGTNLNIVRLTISPTAQQLLKPTAQGLRYNWQEDRGTQAERQAIQPLLNRNKSMEPMLKRGRPIIYAVPFTPPVQWKTDQAGYPYVNGNPYVGGSLNPAHYQDCAGYLVDFVDYYRKVLHVNIDVLSLQNEPNVCVPWPSCHWTGKQLHDFLEVLATKVNALESKPLLMLSEGSYWSIAQDLLQPTLDDGNARHRLGIMASHSYEPLKDCGKPVAADNNQARDDFSSNSANYGLPVWMSEMSIIGSPEDDGMGAAMSIAHYIQRDLVKGRAAAWIYCFAIFRPYTHNINGSLSVLSVAKDGTLIVPKRFWAMANYSHFVRPGWKRIQIDGVGFVNAGFINPEGNGFAIVALNPTAKPQPVTYDFGNGTISDEIKAYRTDQDMNLASVTPPEKESSHRFTTTLPPMSVTTFTGELWHGITQPKPYEKPGKAR
jgi:glucuronoarabinoxylan endo-1,4-beta-xylanase